MEHRVVPDILDPEAPSGYPAVPHKAIQNKKNWQKLKHLHNNLLGIYISIDAATEETTAALGTADALLSNRDVGEEALSILVEAAYVCQQGHHVCQWSSRRSA